MKIPYGRQEVTSDDVSAVVEVLNSDYLTQGPVIPRFERAVAGHTGAKQGVAANSATSALHIACLALDLGPNDLLWTVPNTFVASANCARYCGADVDFVDIDPLTWNLSTVALERKLEFAAQRGRLPKIVVPVHFSGQPTEQERIWELASRYGFSVIEDASHSIGASRSMEAVGSCRWSDVTIFSFHPVKIVTSAEGGMALTNDDSLAKRMSEFRTHGITRDPSRFTNLPGDGADPEAADIPWYYEQQELGYNYRMSDLHAALGLSQLSRLTAYVERRNRLAARYDERLAGLPVQLPTIGQENVSAFHLYVVRLADDASGALRNRVFRDLRRRGIGVNVHYIPVHLHPYYRTLGFRPGDFPESEAYGRTAITLPLFPALTEEQQDLVIQAVTEAL